MAIAFVSASSTVNVTASPALPVFAGGNTAGNIIIIAAAAFSRTGEFITSITDSQGNSYSAAGTIHEGSPSIAQTSFWFANNIVGGAGANTVTVNYSGGTRTEAIALEYSGASVSPVDTRLSRSKNIGYCNYFLYYYSANAGNS